MLSDPIIATSTITLRPYQQTCVEQALAAYEAQPIGGKALVVLPTGGGKTIVFTEIARRLGLPTLIIAHRQELLSQAADKFRMVDAEVIIGQVGAGRHDYGAPVTVASIQTISQPNHLKMLPRFGYGLVIVDECFPAGTLIDGKPIEQIKIGDMVTAFNEHTRAFERRRVVQTFRRPVGTRLLKITAGDATVACTPNHPFYTRLGWKSAERLSQNEEILYVRDHRLLHTMPSPFSSDDQASAGTSESGETRLLFGHLQACPTVQDFIRNNGSDQQKVCKCTHESQQSDAQRRMPTQSASNASGDGTCSQGTRRQWKGANATTEDVSRSIGLADGVRSENGDQTQQQPQLLPNFLQVGYRQPDSDDSHRGRWPISCVTGPSSTRPEERTGADWTRVDRIEIHEPGSDGTFGGLCPDGTVYNFEVEGDHTYIANGFVVHNCHHSPSSGYRAVLDALPDAFVLGVTATPDRLDKKSIESIFGEPVFKASILDLIEEGFLCDLRAIAVHTTTSLDEVHTQGGDFKSDELEEAVDTEERNKRVVAAYLEHCPDRQALCFSVTVDHAKHLADTFKTYGVRAAVVSGGTHPDERRSILADYEQGKLSVVCNCGVLTEGYDNPQTSCIILPRPTQSRALFTQMTGRGTRLAPGKTNCIILDITDNVLKHRLEPVTLSSALDLDLHDGESVIEARARKKKEGERRERTAKVTRRTQDLQIDLTSRLDWKRSPSGLYLLEIGENKHRIKLVPEASGFYSVRAELAPDYCEQLWIREATLSEAQQHAEAKARLLMADSKKLILVDANAPWRTRPASAKQLSMLKLRRIPFSPGITSGEASDLIGSALDKKGTSQSKRRSTAHGKRR